MSVLTLAMPGPFEPERCVPRGPVRARPSAVPAVLVIVIVAAWVLLVLAGLSPYAATAGLASVAGLGVRIAARLPGRTSGDADA